MDHNELQVQRFDYACEISRQSIQNVINGHGAYDSACFPSCSGHQWVVRISRSCTYNYDTCLKIIPQHQNFVFAKLTVLYNNAKLGTFYYNKNGISDPTDLSLAQVWSYVCGSSANSIVKIIIKANLVFESAIGLSPNGQISKSLLKMREDFGNLYDSKQNSDITFCVRDKVVKAHKAILIARSAVFAAMFENQLEECQTGRISITDADAEVVEEMLCYMYTGKAPKLDTMTAELLECAEKYQLDELKENCLKCLQNHITVEKAASTLILADRYRSNELKRHAIKYITGNAKAVTSTKAWKDMIRTNAHLIEEAFRELALRPTTNG